MGVTRKLGVHQRTVREAGRNAVPPQRKKTERPAVKTYVERRKHALGLAEHEVFVPQSYDWRVAEQVDWYEGYADLDDERIKLQVSSMRSMASVRPFIGGIHLRHCRLCLKRMNLLSSISRAPFCGCATITFRARRRRSLAASNAS